MLDHRIESQESLTTLSQECLTNIF